MKQLYIFFKAFLPAIMFALAILMPVSAIADQGKASGNGFSNGVRTSLTALRSKNIYRAKTATGATRAIADTTTKITSLGKNKGGEYEIVVNLVNEDSRLEITVFNILGRKLVDVWKGDAPKGELRKEIPTSSLPEGMYICVVQGKDFRLAEKFIISR